MNRRLGFFIGGALVSSVALVAVLGWNHMAGAPSAHQALQQARQQGTVAEDDDAPRPPVVRRQPDAGSDAGKEAPASPRARDMARETGKDAAPSATVSDGKDAATASAPAPSFDIVRVEADGSTVMAGRAAPGAVVEILVNGEVVARVRADDNGEWSHVPDKPLFSGAEQLVRLRARQPSGEMVEAPQALVVSMAPVRRGGKPLVMLSEADAPSRILQEPRVADARAPATRNVDSGPRQAGEGDGRMTLAEAAGSTGDVDDAGGAGDEAGREEQSAMPAADTRADGREGGGGEAGSGVADGRMMSEKGETPGAVAGAAADSARERERRAGNMAAARAGAKQVDEAAREMLARLRARESEKPPATTPATTPAPPPTLQLRTVDYDSAGAIFFTGRSEARAALRLYVDNEFLADVRANERGFWSWKGRAEIAPGRHDLRVDRLGEDGRVIERIELPFVRASREALAAARERRRLAEVRRLTQERRLAAAPSDLDLEQTLEREAEMTRMEEEGVSARAGAPPPQRRAEDMRAVKEERRDVEAPEAGKADMRATAAMTPPAREAGAGGAGDEQRDESGGFIIVQPGNNLWNIARVIYGRGIRYTTIYEANREQIRDPDLIYPGQVFTAPGLPARELRIPPRRRTPLQPEELERLRRMPPAGDAAGNGAG